MPAAGANAASRSPAESATVSNPSSAPRPTVGAAVVMRCMADQVPRRPAGVTPETQQRHGRRRERRHRPVPRPQDERTAMATLCRAYTSEDDARAAVDRLLAAGIAGSEVHVLAGAAVHDARDEAIGGYAGTADGDAVVGAYAGAAHSAREAM